MTDLLERAAQARAAGMAAPADRPRERRSLTVGDAPASMRFSRTSTEHVERHTAPVTSTQIGGYASVTESPYEMYDSFGPYAEVVSRGAFGATLASAPLVEFTLNHGKTGSGIPMAHTRNGTLTLGEDETGLSYLATVDPRRSDVADVLLALSRGDLAEASFKFSITSGLWSPDYTEFRIAQVDIDHGDVSTVNFGANPAATSELRERIEIRATRALDAPDVNMMTQVLGWLTAIDMIVDEAQEQLAAYLHVPSPDSCDCCGDGCTCGDCASCPTTDPSGAMSMDAAPIGGMSFADLLSD